MIREYAEKALRSARYDKLEDGTFYGEVPRLHAVFARDFLSNRVRYTSELSTRSTYRPALSMVLANQAFAEFRRPIVETSAVTSTSR